ETEQWRHQRNLFRYLIARWGYSTALAGWVVVCEINGTNGDYFDPAEADAWCAAVADYFRACDPNRTNHADQHPIVATKTYYSAWDPGFDMRSLDCYDLYASTIAGQTAGMRASGKPAFHAEFGLMPHHGGIWAGFASGAAMTPLVWCDGGGFPLMSDPVSGEPMRAQLEILADFAASMAYLGDPALASASVSTDASPDCWGAGMMLPDRGFAWVQYEFGSVGGTEVTVSDVADGIYDVDWFDVWSDGSVPHSTTQDVLVSGGSLVVTVPATLPLEDVALRFSPSP
ncbi:MAG: glycoside hydrolase 5 family protein, partial [Planctomycetota bacterium]